MHTASDFTPTPRPRRIPWQRQLKKLNACREARRWARPYATARIAWAACQRPDWLLWIVGRASWGRTHGSPEHRQLTLLAVLIARTTLHLVPEGPRAELEEILAQIEGWAWGHLSLSRETLLVLRQRTWEIRSSLWRAAADAAAAAVTAAVTAAAYAAAYAAAVATTAAYAAADAYADAAAADAYATAAAYAYAYAAAYAAADAAAYATNAAYWAARSAALRAHRAGICRLIRAAVPCPL